MNQIQLFAKKQGTETYTLLDLHSAEPIKLTLSVQNIIDPTASTSVFSRTFKVPHTSVNGPFFEGVFNVNSMDFDASKKADAYILDNGIFYVNGNITMNAIYNNEADNSIEYEVTFYGATSDFGTKIGGGFLNQVDLNKYNHSKDYANITASWENGLFNGDVVYGLIEWGYTYNKNNQPNIPTLSANFPLTPYPTPGHTSEDPKGSFTNPQYPYLLEQFKPQLRAKALWDSIFEESGYTYDSEFLNSSLFKNMYIISENIAEPILDNANTFAADEQTEITRRIATTFQWMTSHELADPGANFNPNTSIYTAPAAGDYQFRIGASEVSVIGHPMDREIGFTASIVDVDTGVTLSSETSSEFFSMDDSGVSNWAMNMGASLQPGQRIKFTVYTYGISGTFSPSTNMYFLTPSATCFSAPAIMSFNAIMPANIRKIDFMKSIINRFRLVFVPSKTSPNHFTITPWKDWILQGRSKDWTDKLDASKDMVIKPLFFDQERFQIYKDQEDSDYLNYNYQLTYKQTYGQLNQDSTNELIKGTKEYKDQFAPTPVDSIGWTTGTITANEAGKFIIPHIAKDSQTNDPAQPGKREPIQPKLRLVFYNGLQPAPATWYLKNGPYDIATYPGGYFAQTKYPLMSQYSSWPVTNTTYDLNWTNKAPFWDKDLAGDNAPGLAITAYDTFNVYWKTWYDTTFDPYSRIVEANFIIDYGDTFDLEFNDYVYIKDAWYFVNQITDYVVGQKSNVRVQLIKLGNNIGITLPVVHPNTYPSALVCTAPTACAAKCCSQYEGATQMLVYPSGATLVDSNVIYGDQYGSTIAAPGYYSDDSGTILVNNTGGFSIIDTSGCSCVPVYYTFNVYKNDSGCNVCCGNGPSVTVYGFNSTFENNTSLFTDTLLTNGTSPGFYKASGGTVALQVGTENGRVLQTYVCSTCQCSAYYSFVVCKSDTKCNSCCCPSGTTTIYGAHANFTDNTVFYANNAGNVFASDGWYKSSTENVSMQVYGGSGVVDGQGTCTGCANCGTSNNVTIGVFQEFPGFSSSMQLQQSFDGVNWVNVTSIGIVPSDLPTTPGAYIYKEVTVSLNPSVYARAIATTNVTGVDAFLNGGYVVDGISYAFYLTPAPTTRILTLEGTIQVGSNYAFYGGGQGGLPHRIYPGGQFTKYETQTWPLNGGGINKAVALTQLDSPTGQDQIATGFNIGYDPNPAVNAFTGGYVQNVAVMPDNNNLLYVGSFTQYKGIAVPGVAMVDESGNLVTAFQSNLYGGITGTSMLAEVLYAGTEHIFIKTSVWNAISTGTKGMIVLNTSGQLVTSLNSISFNGLVTAVTADATFGQPKYYLIGDFTTVAKNSGGSITCNRIISLDAWSPSTEYINTAFVQGTGYAANTGTLFLDCIKYYNSKLYVTIKKSNTNIPTYKGVSLSTYSGIQRINLDGSNDTSWTMNRIIYPTGSVPRIRISKLGKGIYTIATTFNSGTNTNNGAIRLDYTGALDNTFAYNNSITWASGNFNVDRSDNIYYYGNIASFTPNGGSAITNPSMVKITSAGVYEKKYLFQDASNVTRNMVITLAAIGNVAVSDNPLQLYTGSTACAAFCHTGMTPVTYYGNGIDLFSSTEIYTDITGSIPAPTGIYSDGIVTYQVYSGIKESTPLDTSTCNCGGVTLLEYPANYSNSTDCDACCSAVVTNVYSSASPWSTTTVLYANAAGTTFAPAGYYAYTNGFSLHVGANGVVLGVSDCAPCGCGIDCRSCRIRSTSAYQEDWSYSDCEGNFYYGTWSPGETFNTGCIDLGSFMSTGSFIVQRALLC